MQGRGLLAAALVVTLWITTRVLVAEWPLDAAPIERPRAMPSRILPQTLADFAPSNLHGGFSRPNSAQRTEALVLLPPFAPVLTPQQAAAAFRRPLSVPTRKRPPAPHPVKPVLAAQDLNVAAQILVGQNTGAVPVQFARAEPNALLTMGPRTAQTTLSTWAFFRPKGASNQLSDNGQLGGSQLGFRLAVPVKALSDASAFALSVRGYAPLNSRTGKEAALGVGLLHRGNPSYGVIAERRIGLDKGGRDAVSVIGFAGVSDMPLVQDFSISAYGQAGLVGARRGDAFADGALTLDHPIANSRVKAGLGIWGAAQPGARRLDVGPQASIPLVIAIGSARISAQWRVRIAGRASPGSGPAITLGADF